MANTDYMNKEDCTRTIAEQLRALYAIYKRFNPEGTYLNLCVLDDDTMMFWDTEHKINYYGKLREE